MQWRVMKGLGTATDLLTMLLYGGYKPQRIHKGGTPTPFSLTGPHRDVYVTTEILSEHTSLNSVNVISVSPFLINRKRISMHQALFLHAGPGYTGPVQVPSSTCTNRLLLAALEEPEDSGTTQKEDVKKTPAIMLAPVLSITSYVY